MEIRKLNSLRGLAALIVFFTHFSDETNWLDGVLGGAAGQYGVMLFFLLSGFLMSYLYFERSYSPDNVKNYFVARAGRILPLYLLVVVGSFLFSITDTPGLYDISSLQSVIAHLLFVYGESVLWSISPEIHFYLAFVIIWPLAAKRPGYVYVVSIAILICLVFTNFPRIFGEVSGIKYNFFHVFRSLPYFLIGMIMGMNYKLVQIPHYLKKHIFVLVLSLIPLMYPEFSPITSDAKTRMWLSYEVLLVMSTVIFCTVFLVPDNNLLLANRIGDFTGKISYSLYLLHLPVIWQVNKLDASVEMKLLIALGASLLISYVTYRLFEKPMARILRHFFKTNTR